MTPFDAFLFDLDNTLCRRDQSAEEVYFGAFGWAEHEPVGTPSELWAALEGDPPRDPADYLAQGFARVAAEHGATVDADQLAEGFLATVDHSAVSFLPGAERALAAAREYGSVGLVTNGPSSRQAVKLDALGLTHSFDVVVFAGDLPRRKPHTDPFDEALGRLGVDGADALYVGDSVEYDVVGGHNAGLRVAWLSNGADGWEADEWPGVDQPMYVLADIGDLVGVLDGGRPADAVS